MSLLQRLIPFMAMLALSACGGGGGNPGTSSFGGGSTGGGTTTVTPAAADVVFVLSAGSVANTGTETVVATATAIDANRNTVAGVPVTVSVNNGGVVTPAGTKTDTLGQLNATIGIGSDRSSRTITVTATSGSIVKTAALMVQDAGGAIGTVGPSDLLLSLGADSISNSGTQTVSAVATALDAKRNVLPGVVVTFSVDAAATIAPAGTTTGTSGSLTAQIGIGTSKTNRTITVTAVAGSITKTATLPVVDAPTVANPTAADLSLALSASTLNNSGSAVIVATATAVDIKRNALAGIPVTITVDSSAVATPSGATTDAQGVVTANIGIGANRSNRVITVTASSGALPPVSASFVVVGAALSASYSPRVDTGSTNNQIEYRLLDATSTAMVNQPVSVTAPGLPSAAGSTDINGKFVYSYTAPASATTLNITATAAGSTATQQVTVQVPGGNSVPPASSTPQSASLTPSPSVVSLNAVGSTTNQVELRALFLGANNQPIPNIRVRFDLADNANSSDARITWLGGNYAYSDATGVARASFIPGQRSSPTNGITVRACYDKTDFAFDANPAAAACSMATSSVTNTLTVASEALSVNIRTNNQIIPSTLTYIKQFVVMVVDAAGQAKPDVLITPSVDLTGYYKGYYVWNGKAWVQHLTLAATENYTWDAGNNQWTAGNATSQPACPNEDANRNGVREASAYVAGATPPAISMRQEDLNWNGDLDPRKADVAIKMVGSARTDASGLAILQIEYGQNLASWVDFVITATASGISGTESRARYSGLLYGVGNLPYPASDVTTESVPPAFVVSPYGRGTVCTDSN